MKSKYYYHFRGTTQAQGWGTEFRRTKIESKNWGGRKKIECKISVSKRNIKNIVRAEGSRGRNCPHRESDHTGWCIIRFSLEYSWECYKKMNLECAQERLCLHNHATCSWSSCIFFESVRMWQRRVMRSGIIQVTRYFMPPALDNINDFSSLNICSSSFQCYYFSFEITNLKLVVLIMNLNIKCMHFREGRHILHILTCEY